MARNQRQGKSSTELRRQAHRKRKLAKVARVAATSSRRRRAGSIAWRGSIIFGGSPIEADVYTDGKVVLEDGRELHFTPERVKALVAVFQRQNMALARQTGKPSASS